jgi:predicted transcriptional regulator
MTEEQVSGLRNMMEEIAKLSKAPSQMQVFYHLLRTGRSMSVKELSTELSLTPKATERAVAKLVDKALIQRASFRQRSYTCDSKEILLGILVNLTDLRDRLERKGL